MLAKYVLIKLVYFILFKLRYEKAEKYEDSLVYLKKSLEVDPDNELVKTKINELTKRMDELYQASRYGPSLPSEKLYLSSSSSKKSKKKKKHKRSSSSSSNRSSSSSSSSDSVKIIKSKSHKK